MNRGGIIITTQRNHKDRLFIRIFQERENLLELYNAVNDSHYVNPDDLEIVTLEDAIYLSMKNDLSFIISSELNLYEHQSTICPNMPLRGFLYIAKQFQGIIADKPNALYSSRLILLPTPRYIVFYNGEQAQPDQQILKLSDSFNNPSKSCIECSVEVLNINFGHNPKLQSACKTLNDYAILIEKIRGYRKQFDTLKEAVDHAVDDCIKNDVLKTFLQKHRGEVNDLVLSQYDEEAYIKSEKEISFDDGYQKCQEKLQPVINEQNAKLKEQSAELDEQSAELDIKSAKIEEQSAELDVKSAKIEEQSAELDVKTAKIEEQSAELDIKSAKIEEQSAELDIKTAKIEEQSAELDVKSTKIEEQQQTINALTKQLQKLQKQINIK